MVRSRLTVDSLRGRVIAIVLGAAVLPLTVIGLWVTRSIANAGESLLRSELEESAARVASAVEGRWSYRLGDLGLLAGNSVAQQVVMHPMAPLAAVDSSYLEQLVADVAIAREVQYRDRSGRLVRTFRQRAQLDSADMGRRYGSDLMPPLLPMHLPVVSPESDTIGQMRALVLLRTILPSDTALRLPNNATVQVIRRDDGTGLLPSSVVDSLFRLERFEAAGEVWLAARRSVADPPIDVVVAGPRGRYVTPFQRATRTGVLAVMIVSLIAILLTAYLTRRVTASLEALADAATAVADGELDRRVDGNGTVEVQRVATAFNSMTESLRRTLGALSQRQALAAVGEYAASLSHEVRNALTPIRVDLQRANEKLVDNADTRTLIARALSSVVRLDASVTSSLRLARGGKTPRRTVDVRDVLLSAARGAESAFVERGARIEAAPIAAPLRVRGDPMALEQMFLNLLLNSAQALKPGGVARVSASPDESVLRAVIVDTGAGIPSEDLSKVLDPFYSTRDDGTGLGLPIARQIATAHGGSLAIASMVGQGTRVEVVLPLFGGASQ
jgi:signal transduction histidine kinase